MTRYSLSVNYYKDSLVSVYFNKTLSSVIKIGNLDKTNKKILDFGCGFGMLKKRIPNSLVFNFDKDEKFSEFKDWKNLEFDIFVANQVFYLLSEEELTNLLIELNKKNPHMILIIGISYQNFLSKIIKKIFNFKNAHKFTKLSYNNQVKILKKKCILIDEVDNFFANKVLKLKFKN